jgi:glycolate oxidase
MATATMTPLLEDRLRQILGRDGVLTSPSELLVYECDGYTIERNKPQIVVFPTSTQQVVEIVKACNESKTTFLPRGAGTSLAGGCLAVGGGVMIALTRMKRILEVNYRDRYAVVESGVVNLWLTNHLKGQGYHFAPDPSSQGLARSAATWRRTPEALTRSNTASPSITSLAWNW